MKNKKYLDFYHSCVKLGRLPEGGLCKSLNDDNLNYFFNDDDDLDGYWGYWAEFYKEPVYTQDVNRELAQELIYCFNPLRQNIVLLLAAMSGEFDNEL